MPPVQLSGATSGYIPYTTEISFCKPIAATPFYYRTDEPPRSMCGVFTRELTDFPLNVPTQLDIGNGQRVFGQSEMALVFVKFYNYPRTGGSAKIVFYNPDGSFMFDTGDISLPMPDPNWTWWSAWAWGVVGRFDNTTGYSGNEIIKAGDYSADVITTWGNAKITFGVTDKTPPPACIPNWQCNVPADGSEKDGCGNQRLNSRCAIPPPPPGIIINNVVITQDSTDAKIRTVTVTGSGTGYYETSLDGVKLNRYLNNGFSQYFIINLSSGSHIVCAGSICKSFIVSDPLPVNRWSCSDNCSTAKTVGEYGSQAECKANCQNTWGWEYKNGVCQQTVTGLYSSKAACDAAHPPHPPPGDKYITLSADKNGYKPGDVIVFTAATNLPTGTVLTLYEQVPVGSDFDVGRATVSNGAAVFNKPAGSKGAVVYYVTGGGIITAYKSNLVTVYITDTGVPGAGDITLEEIAMYGIGAVVLTSLLRR